jgi:hypothetical protein
MGFFMSSTHLSITTLKFILFLLCLTIFITAVQAEPAFQKGMCYAAWEKERYASVYSDRSLEALAQTGTEWVAIVTTYYQDKYNSKEIFPTEKTPSDKSIIHTIKKAQALGLKVMLKPHIDLLDQSDGLWRADIGFQNQSDWQAWFSQYLKFILHYAEIAQSSGVEIFCIGTELSFASTETSFWQEKIIPRVREVYSGKLIYAANWDEYKKIKFWNDLDFVGIDAYFPLVQKKDPEYDEIKSAWIKQADEIESWQKRISKPIIFTEIGFPSSESAAAKPWENASNRKVDLRIQANCYKVVLDVLYKRDWCRGIYWWYWQASVYAGGLNNRDFTPQNKPAEAVLTYWYRGLSVAQLPSTSISQK